MQPMFSLCMTVTYKISTDQWIVLIKLYILFHLVYYKLLSSSCCTVLTQLSCQTLQVTFYHRQNGGSTCQDQAAFSCEEGVCTSFNKSSVLQTDQDDTGQGRWCQSEGHTTATVSTNETSFSLGYVHGLETICFVVLASLSSVGVVWK